MGFLFGRSRERKEAEALSAVWANLGVKDEREFARLCSEIDIPCCCCSATSGICCESDGADGFISKPEVGTAFVAACANCLERMLFLCQGGSIVAVEHLRSSSDLLSAFDRAEDRAASPGTTLVSVRRNAPAPLETTFSWHAKGAHDLAVGRYAAAIACFDRALAINPKSARVWRDKGVALSQSGGGVEAIACFSRSLGLNKFDAVAWFNKGTSLQRMNQASEAVVCFDKAIEIEPSDADIWCNKAIALQALGKTADELQCYEEALKLNSNHVEAWLNRGCALAARGDLRGAMESFDRVLSLNPMDSDAAYNKAAAHLQLGESAKALAAFRRFSDIANREDPRLSQVKQWIKTLDR